MVKNDYEQLSALKRRQIELLYGNANAASYGGLLAVALAVLLFRGTLSMGILLPWAAVAVSVELIRLAVVARWRHCPEEEQGDERWEARYVFFAFLIGMIWGGGGVLLYPTGSVAELAKFSVLLAGLSIATVAFQSSVRYGSTAFLIPAVLPLGLRALLGTDELHSLLGLFLIAFAIVVAVVQARARANLLNLLTSTIESERRVRQCTETNIHLNHAQRIAGFGSWEWDLRGGQLWLSPEACRLLGLESDGKIARQTFIGTLHVEDRSSYQRAVEAALQRTSAMNVEYRVVLPDGKIRVLHEEAEVLRDASYGPVLLRGVVNDVSARADSDQNNRDALRELSRILDNMQDTYFRADASGKITFVSPSIEALLGFAPSTYIGKRLTAFYANAQQGDLFLDELSAQGGAVRNYEIQLRHYSGAPIWVSVNAQFVRDSHSVVVGIEGTARDISELKRAQDALYEAKERALVMLQSIGDGVVSTDEHGNIQYLNPIAEHLLDTSNDQASGLHYLEVLRLNDEVTGEPLGDLVKLCLTRETGVVHADEGQLVRPGGGRFHLKITAAPMRDRNGHVIGAVLVLHDITEVMGMARQLSYQASHDMLTGLYNRRVFETRVEEALRDAHNGGGPHVLFYMDLDQFKVVNDTCGHQAGDELLEQIATLMHGRVRESDVLARLGGDEFGVLLGHCALDKAVLIAEDIRQAVRDYRFAWEQKSFELGVTIGVVPIEHGSGTLADVLAAADAACYVAKDRGRNRIHVCQPDDHAVAQRHGEMEWVHRLAAAFDEDRFLLYAQPVVHLGSERVIAHYEVLMRMCDEQGNVIPPGAFVPAAERYNLMPTVDRWVIRTTFTLLREAQGDMAFPPVDCAINISGQSICDDQFLEYVVELFKETGIPPESICFEVTETAAIANLSRASRVLNTLHQMGCSFALDDFGSGLSSFAYLKSLPVDYLKIDGSFVKDMMVDRVDRAMVESINQIGHVLGLKTIGEFAESELVIEALERIGVDYAQGAGVALPQPLQTILASYKEVARSEATAGRS